MDITCPKCKSAIEVDGSMLYDEFVYNYETCETCGANLAYNDVGNVLFMSPHEPISVTVDVIISNNGGDVLFIKRKFPPFQGKWALPGGFVNSHETCEEAAVREIFEETGLSLNMEKLRQVAVFSKPARDPRGRVVSILYIYNEAVDTSFIAAGDDAADVKFMSTFSDINAYLAFDHADMIKYF